MKILVGLIPAIFWGIMPIFVNKFGGKPINQLLGTVYGSAVAGLVAYLIVRPELSLNTFVWCFIAGAGWSFGQIAQYSSYPEIGVSITMPMSTGVQLIGTSLVGVLFFGSWASGSTKLAGFLAILLIIVGVCMTAVHDSHSASSQISRADFKAGMMNCVFGAIGYILCNSLPKVTNASGWAMILPQSLGMLASAIVIALAMKRYRTSKPFFKKVTFENIVTGLSFGIAECSYLSSMNINGLSTGFVLSQMCVVVSTLCGIFIIHEHKTPKELGLTLGGLVLVVIGGSVTGLI